MLVVGASVSTLISALFVLGYDGIKYHNSRSEHICLPDMLGWFHAISPWMFVVPSVVLVLGLLLLKRPSALTVMVTISWLFALAWPLACILAWKVPDISGIDIIP